MSISNKLTELNGIKQDIKQAIVDKGVDMTGVAFDGYAAKIAEIPTGGGGGGFNFSLYTDGAAFDLQFADGTGGSYTVTSDNNYNNVVWLKLDYVAMTNDYYGITEQQALNGHFLTEDVSITLIND